MKSILLSILLIIASNSVLAASKTTLIFSNIKSAVSPAGSQNGLANELQLKNAVEALFRSQGIENRENDLYKFNFLYASINDNKIEYTYAYNAGVVRGSNSCIFILKFTMLENSPKQYDLMSVITDSQCTQD